MKKFTIAALCVAVAFACEAFASSAPESDASRNAMLSLDGGLGRFTYVDANPLQYIDPEGLQHYMVPRRPGWPEWAQPTNPNPNCATAECAAGLAPLRPTPYSSPDFNRDPCVIAYLRENYGNFMADTLLPYFSGLSYVPGSGHARSAYASLAVSGLGKGAIVGSMSAAAAGAQAMGAPTVAMMAGGAATGAGWLLASGGVGATAYSTTANAAALLHCSCRR